MSRTVLYTGTQAKDISHVDGVFFHCDRCKKIKTVQTNGGTGYGRPQDTDTLRCYACCGQLEKLRMIETGRSTLYLSKADGAWKVTDWAGLLVFVPHSVRRFKHPFSSSALIAYFIGPDGKTWSAKNIGDTQIAHCRRLKS